MFSLRGFCVATLVLAVRGLNDVSTTTIYSPYKFGFNKTSRCLLNMEITLQNIPPSVTAVTATQFTYYDSMYRKGPQTVEVKVNVDDKAREGKFMIQTSLTRSQTWVDVELHNQTGLCNETRIIEGRDSNSYYYWDTTLKKYEYYNFSHWKHNVSGYCVAPKACEIIVDLKDTCEDQRKSNNNNNFVCHIIESQYICTFVRAAKNYQELVLSQTYEDDSVMPPLYWTIIGPKTTKLSIKLELELFDTNTSVKLGTQARGTIIWPRTLSITAKDVSKASIVTILKYTDTTDVQFSCAQYQHRSTKIHVGFINTTDNKITTHNTTIMKINHFKMADNGTILCCLFYEYQEGNEKHEITTTRFVENKTLLIYQSHESTSTNLTGPTESPVPTNNTNDESPAPNNKPKDESSVTAGLLTGLAVVMGAAAIVGCIFILHMKKCYRVKSTSEEPPQTHLPPNPFYVNLLFRKECQAEIYAAEHIYEEIN